MNNPTIAAVVFPARDFNESVAAWSTVFGTGPTFSSDGIEKAPGDADFAVFKSAETEIGLTSMPWVDEPLVLLSTDDIDTSRQELIAAGAMPLAEIADGSLSVLGTAPVTNGDPETGIVDVPGFPLAAVKPADRSKVELRQPPHSSSRSARLAAPPEKTLYRTRDCPPREAGASARH